MFHIKKRAILTLCTFDKLKLNNKTSRNNSFLRIATALNFIYAKSQLNTHLKSITFFIDIKRIKTFKLNNQVFPVHWYQASP